MEKEINKIHKRLRRSKFAVFLIVAFLALLTYLLIIVSSQVSNEEAFNASLYAATNELDEIVRPERTDGIWPPSCAEYSERITTMREKLLWLRKKLKCKGDLIGGSIGPDPDPLILQELSDPNSPLADPGPKKCVYIDDVLIELIMIEDLIKEKCSMSCPDQCRMLDGQEKLCKKFAGPHPDSIDSADAPIPEKPTCEWHAEDKTCRMPIIW